MAQGSSKKSEMEATCRRDPGLSVSLLGIITAGVTILDCTGTDTGVTVGECMGGDMETGMVAGAGTTIGAGTEMDTGVGMGTAVAKGTGTGVGVGVASGPGKTIGAGVTMGADTLTIVSEHEAHVGGASCAGISTVSGAADEGFAQAST